jgi:hypothetical protein
MGNIHGLYIHVILNAVFKYLLFMDTADCSLQQLLDSIPNYVLPCKRVSDRFAETDLSPDLCSIPL